MNKDVVGYSTSFKWLHWVVACLVLGMLAVGFFLGDFPNGFKPTAYMLHKSTGLTILTLMLLRVVWIAYSGKPALPSSVPRWQRVLAQIVQYAMYVFLIAMPLSGWLMATASNKIPVYFGWFRVPFPGLEPSEDLSHWMNSAHIVIAFILIALVGLHIAGALTHRLIQKDDVFERMMP